MTAPIYFGRNRRLFGWYHGATGPTHRECGVVICSPLGYEELCAHRALRHWADALAHAGIPTLRFDYEGTGNSAGCDTDPNRVRAWISSVEDAVADLRSRSGVRHVVLIGVRLGGTLALAAAERAGVDTLVLFATPAGGRSYAREIVALGRLMRAGGDSDVGGSSNDGSVEQVAGFVMTRETIAELALLDPSGSIAGVRRVLVIPRDDVGADMNIDTRLAEHGVDVECSTRSGYRGMMVDAHESVAPREVIQESIRWLTSHYGARASDTPSTKDVRSGSRDSVREAEIDAGILERAVIFERGLFGVLSERDGRDARCGTGIVLASAGSVHTVGPGRLYVELAREWATRGFSVLRMDVGGVGDSETPPGGEDNHPYPDNAVRDIASAARWMVEHAGVHRVIVAGLCSGAHASFHAGLELDGIEGIMVINPIVFYWTPACALDVAAWMSYQASRQFSRAVRDVDSWVRLVHGDVRVRTVATVGYRRMREVTAGAAASLWRRLGVRSAAAEDVGADLGRISARGVDVLLVFSDGDPGLDFVQRRYARDVRLLERDRSNFAMRVVPNADHTFTRLEARGRLARLLTEHLEARHRPVQALGQEKANAEAAEPA